MSDTRNRRITDTHSKDATPASFFFPLIKSSVRQTRLSEALAEFTTTSPTRLIPRVTPTGPVAGKFNR
jgi:hypothetical protein